MQDSRDLLELLASDPEDQIPLSIFVRLLEKHFGFQNSEQLKRGIASRIISSATLLTSTILAEYSNCENHYSEFQGWMILCSTILGFKERWKLKEKYWKKEFEVAFTLAINSLENLFDEVESLDELLVEDVIDDVFVIRSRLTLLFGLLATRNLLVNNSDGDFLDRYWKEHNERLQIAGEFTFPFYLSAYFYFKQKGLQVTALEVIKQYLATILSTHINESIGGTPTPYYDEQQIFLHVLGNRRDRINDSFWNRSYTVLPIINLLALEGEYEFLKSCWNPITKIQHEEILADDPWEYYRYRIDLGVVKSFQYPFPTDKKFLAEKASTTDKEYIFPCFDKYPLFHMALLLVYPHRANQHLVKSLYNYFLLKTYQ